MSKTDDRMYTDTRCDKCGGPTIQIGSGSIWCPSEDCTPGGHFVVRVAFAQAPTKQPRPFAASRGAVAGGRIPVPAIKSQPKDDGFDTGLDGFVKSDR